MEVPPFTTKVVKILNVVKSRPHVYLGLGCSKSTFCCTCCGVREFIYTLVLVFVFGLSVEVVTVCILYSCCEMTQMHQF